MRPCLILIGLFVCLNASAQSYVHLAESYAQTQPDSAVHYANLGLREAEKKGDRQTQAGLLIVLGDINRHHHQHELSHSLFIMRPFL